MIGNINGNFEIKLEDNFPLANPQGITNGTFNLIINVPPTASISETRITFEGGPLFFDRD